MTQATTRSPHFHVICTIFQYVKYSFQYLVLSFHFVSLKLFISSFTDKFAIYLNYSFHFSKLFKCLPNSGGCFCSLSLLIFSKFFSYKKKEGSPQRTLPLHISMIFPDCIPSTRSHNPLPHHISSSDATGSLY